MFGWGRQPQSLRDRQVLGLKQNHQIVTVQENVRYRANFKNRWGNMNFLIELPPNFPAVAPSLRFEKQVQHAWVDGRGHIMHNEVRNWGPHSDLARLVNDCIKQFVAVPPTPGAARPAYQPPPPAGGQGNRPPPPSYQQPGFQQQPPPGRGGFNNYNQQRPPPTSYNQYNQPNESPNVKPVAAKADELSEFDEPSKESEEPEPEIDPIVFQVPDKFEILDDLQEEDLQNLLKDRSTLKDWALSAPTYKSAREMQESTRTALREAAQHNLAQQQPMEDEKRRLAESRAEVDTLMAHYDSLKERKEKVLQRYSREAIASELDRLIKQTNDEAGQLKEKFEEEEIKVARYVNQLIKIKTLGRLREIKLNRLQ